MACHIDNFTDEIEAGYGFRFHCLGGQRVRVYAAAGDLGRAEAFTAGRFNVPVIDLQRDVDQLFIAHIGDALFFDTGANMIGEPLRQYGLNDSLDMLPWFFRARSFQKLKDVFARAHIDGNSFARFPIG